MALIQFDSLVPKELIMVSSFLKFFEDSADSLILAHVPGGEFCGFSFKVNFSPGNIGYSEGQ